MTASSERQLAETPALPVRSPDGPPWPTQPDIQQHKEVRESAAWQTLTTASSERTPATTPALPVRQKDASRRHTQRLMRSISIRQPWAWSVMQGRKTVLNRYWGTELGPVAIHASLTWDSAALDSYVMREAWALHHMEEASREPGKLLHQMFRSSEKASMFAASNPIFPIGVILGVVDIVGVHQVDPVRGCFHEVDAFGESPASGWVPFDGSHHSDIGWKPRFCSPWANVPDHPTRGSQRSMKHLVLESPRLLSNPLPFSGHYNIHRLPPGIEQIIRSGLKR